MVLLQQLKVEPVSTLKPTPRPQFPDISPPHQPRVTTLQKSQRCQLDLPPWRALVLYVFWGPVSSKLGKSPCNPDRQVHTGRRVWHVVREVTLSVCSAEKADELGNVGKTNAKGALGGGLSPHSELRVGLSGSSVLAPRPGEGPALPSLKELP